MDTPPTSHPSSDRLPGWLAEALDVLSARRRIVVATAVGLVLLGAIVALVAPSILPARAVVGAAVGVAAALLATALALAMDASDLVVRGVRHVRAAGGTVDVHVGRQHDDVGPLLAAVARHASGGQVRVALSSASRTAGVPGVRAAALAEALARTGRKVLLTDLARGGTPAAGLSDVIAGSRTLPEVVRFEQELYLARLAVGSDPDAAIRGFAGWVDGLPSDLEVLVAALPPLADPGVLAAAGAMDVTLVLVEVDRTERVDLIASLDAVDASGLTSELVLVDPDRTPDAVVAETEDDEDAADEGVADEGVADEEPAEGEPEGAVADDDLPGDPVLEAGEVSDEVDSTPDEPVATTHEDVASVPTPDPTPADDERDDVMSGPTPDSAPAATEDDDVDPRVEPRGADDVLAAIGVDVPDADTHRPESTDEDEPRSGDAATSGWSGEIAGLLGGAAAGTAATWPAPYGADHATDEPTDDGGADTPLADEHAHRDPADERPDSHSQDDAVAREVEPDADATAEIPLTPAASDEDLSAIWDSPPPSVPTSTPTPAAPPEPPAEGHDPAPSAATEPEPKADSSPVDEPQPSSEHAADPQSDAVTPVAPFAEPEPEGTLDDPVPAADRGDAPAPEPSPEPRPVPAAPATGSESRELEGDPAALEVARTSAALHQLAQQIWDRDDR